MVQLVHGRAEMFDLGVCWTRRARHAASRRQVMADAAAIYNGAAGEPVEVLRAWHRSMGAELEAPG